MMRYIFLVLTVLLCHVNASEAQDSITVVTSSDTSRFMPHVIPYVLKEDSFMPSDRLQGLTPWMSAPLPRPAVHIVPVYGFDGYGFGQFTVDHFDKFFSNLLGFNLLNVPQLTDSQQMMLGNTISLGKKRRWFFANGILYGREYGTWGNMIGMGTREGLIFRPSGVLMISVWTQEYQSVYAYSPVVYAYPGESAAAVRLPASPVVISYGAQAYFLAGQFWIGIGASLWTEVRHDK